MRIFFDRYHKFQNKFFIQSESFEEDEIIERLNTKCPIKNGLSKLHISTLLDIMEDICNNSPNYDKAYFEKVEKELRERINESNLTKTNRIVEEIRKLDLESMKVVNKFIKLEMRDKKYGKK